MNFQLLSLPLGKRRGRRDLSLRPSISNFRPIAFLIVCCLLTLSFIFVPLLNSGLIFAEAVEITENGGAETPKEEVLTIWQKTWNRIKDYRKDTLWPWIAELCSSLAQRFTQTIKGFWEREIKQPIEEEAEKRKEVIEEKVKEEKKELEEKLISETTRSVWEKLKDFWE